MLAALASVVVLWVSSAFADSVQIPPPPEQWLTDTASFLSPAARTALNERLERYEQQSGHQVVVWIGSSIGDRPLDEFAVSTFKSWQLGRKKLDDGLLMIVLARDRKIDIEVGYGLEDRVPDAVASRIIREVMAPRLRSGDADGALSAGIDATLQAIDGKAFAPGPGERNPVPVRPALPPLPVLIVMGLLGLAFVGLLVTHPSLALYLLVVLSGRGGGGGFGGGGGGGFGGGGGGGSGGGGARGSW
jgi:uncharacterized protein